MFKITEECIGCCSCCNNCPVDAIEIQEKPFINQDVCIGCGACTAACPVGAIVKDY